MAPPTARLGTSYTCALAVHEINPMEAFLPGDRPPRTQVNGSGEQARHAGNVTSLGGPLWTPQESPHFSRSSEETCLF